MHDLQLTLPRTATAGNSLAWDGLRRLWLRGVRRALDNRIIGERRRFEAVRKRFYEDLWADAAHDVGATIERVRGETFRIARHGRSTFVDRSTLMLDSALADQLLLDKALTYRWLAAKGLPTVPNLRFTLSELDRAEQFLGSSPAPVVVKPADGTGCGYGVTTGIIDKEGLRRAARHATAFHPSLLVERQLAGASYRLLFLDGRFLDAVRRDPPVVLGDGRATIAHLVARENARRLTGQRITALSPLAADMECRNTLARAGMRLDSIPEEGRTVGVKLAVNENSAAQNHVVRDAVHPAIIAAGERVSRELRIGLAGLDVTATDISAPPDHPDTYFNEINVGAGLHHHYLVSTPSCIAHVAPRILEHIFTTGHGAVDL